MKRRAIAILMAAMVMASMAPATTYASFDVEAEFEPNAEYEKYTVFEYTLEALSTDIIVTLCAKGENEYEILTNFYGDDQDWVGTYDGTAVTTISDKTGFMEGDAPAIIQAGIDLDNWAAIGEAAPAEEAAADDKAEKKPVDFGVEPEFEAKEGYPVFTVMEYTIESLSTDIVATVSANEEFTEFDIQCNFYGDDQDWEGTYDAAAETVETKADKTGFMEGDAPAIIKAAIEKDLWAWSKDGTSIKEEPAAEEAAEDAAAGEVKFDVEPEFDPNPDYEKYTVFEYTLESLSTDIIVTLCAKGENEYEILCNFYGDDQDWTGTYDGTAVTTASDKTGFMEGDAPAIIQAGIDADNWAPIQ